MLAVLLVLSLTACAGSNTPAEDSSTGSIQNAADSSQAQDDTLPTASEEDAQPDEAPDAGPETVPEPDGAKAGSRILAACFSATNNTAGIAQKLADGLGAELYEIVPRQPYTAEDLNYSDRSTRATAEQNDPDVRPVISDTVENMDDYDLVMIG